MAKALKCDRCGILYEIPFCKPDVLLMRSDKPHKTLDLCLGCQSELENWIDDYKEGKEEATE